MRDHRRASDRSTWCSEKMIAKYKDEATDKDIEDFKKIVSEELTPYASSILLDPEYGLPAANARAESAGLLLAYEKTGYDATTPGRLPDSLNVWSVKRLKEAGQMPANSCSITISTNPMRSMIRRKLTWNGSVRNVAEGIPFFLELVSYDANIADASSKEYAQVKPHKVNDMMKVFSDPRYNVDVLKVEVPVNMKFVEGFGDESVYTKRRSGEII